MADTLRDKLIQKGWATEFDADTLVCLIEEHYAALADEPAAREPAAVTGQPSVEELALVYHDCCGGCEFMDQGGFEDAAGVVLARWGNRQGSLDSSPPADGEVAELVAWLRQEFVRNQQIGNRTGALQSLRAAELLQRQALVPVAVSERLPGHEDVLPWPEDPGAGPWCWMGKEEDGGWEWQQRSAGYLVAFPGDFTHWLPAHALPIPQQQETNNG